LLGALLGGIWGLTPSLIQKNNRGDHCVGVQLLVIKKGRQQATSAD